MKLERFSEQEDEREINAAVNVNNITAICAIIIALASLSISVMEGRAAREHNRQSVRPTLRIVRVKTHGDSWTGLKLKNVGLGPAVIVETVVKFDGNEVGRWDRATFDLLVGPHKPIPNFSALYNDTVIPAGGEEGLIFIADFDEVRDAWFWKLIAHRLDVEVRYESIYGGERFSQAKHPRHS